MARRERGYAPGSGGPLVSVVIPAYNAEATIEGTIDSVLAQTYQVFEILVVDDGSQDRTAAIVQSRADNDRRILLFRQANQGVAAARNLGIRRSSGEFVAPLDADDLWFAEKLEKQVALMQKSPQRVGLVSAWSLEIFDDGRPPNPSRGWAIRGSVFLPLLLGNFIGDASSPLLRRQCFDDVGMYSSEFWKLGAQGCEDWDLYLRIAEHFEFRDLPEYLVGYRQTTGAMSSDWRKMNDSYRLLIDRVKRQHPQIPAFVFRWSNANFLLYLAQKALRAGGHADAIALLSRATLSDPYLLVNRRVRRLIAKSLTFGLGGRFKASRPMVAAENPLEYDLSRWRSDSKPYSGEAWARRLQQRVVHLQGLQDHLGLNVPLSIGSMESSAGLDF